MTVFKMLQFGPYITKLTLVVVDFLSTPEKSLLGASRKVG